MPSPPQENTGSANGTLYKRKKQEADAPCTCCRLTIFMFPSFLPGPSNSAFALEPTGFSTFSFLFHHAISASLPASLPPPLRYLFT